MAKDKKAATAKSRQALSHLSPQEHVDKVTTLIAAFAVGGLVIAVVIGYFGIYQPFTNTQTIRAETAAYNQHTENLEEVLENTETLQEEINDNPVVAEAATQLVPQDLDEEYLLQALADAANESQVFLASYEPQQVSEGGAAPVEGVNEYAFEINVTGPYESIKNFINLLENGSRHVRVGEMSFSVDQNSLIFGANDAVVSVTIGAVAYSQNPLNPAPVENGDPATSDQQSTQNPDGQQNEDSAEGGTNG